MRGTVLGILLVAGLIVTAMGAIPAHSDVAPHGAIPGRIAVPNNQMIVESTVVEGRYQQVVVVDPRQNTLAVYHVELVSGNVELRCVRNITWDLQMTHFNGKKPLPSEIQSLLERR